MGVGLGFEQDGQESCPYSFVVILVFLNIHLFVYGSVGSPLLLTGFFDCGGRGLPSSCGAGAPPPWGSSP